jgi:hypothetical protein
MLVFINGSREAPCVTGTFAFTAPGSRVIRLCVEELKRTWLQDQEHTVANFIDEMLHTLGLGENPPSSAEITRRVHVACRSRAYHEQRAGRLQVGDVGGIQRTTRSSSHVPAAASATGAQSWPRIHIDDPYVRDGARRILDAAATLLANRQCEDVTSDLVDLHGQPLATRLAELGMKASDHLRIILFSDGAGQRACKRDEILADTAHSRDWRLARSWLFRNSAVIRPMIPATCRKPIPIVVVHVKGFSTATPVGS